MQVNNSTSPNFRALTVTHNSITKKALQNLSKNNLEEIKKVGDRLRATKFFDIALAGTGVGVFLNYELQSKNTAKLSTYNITGSKEEKISEAAQNEYNLNSGYKIKRKNTENAVHTYEVTKHGNNEKFKYNLKALNELASVAIELDNIASNVEKKEIERMADEIIQEFGV